MTNKRFEMLPVGEARAVKARGLRVLWGLKSDRAVRQAVHSMRCAGLIVCSSGSGYYRPESLDEINRTVKRLQSQAKRMFSAAQGAVKVLKDAGGAS